MKVIEGDCIEAMREMPSASVDAIVTDPPYGLEFMGKEWDRLDSGLPQEAVWKGRRGNGGASIGTDDSYPASRHRVALGAGKKHAFKRCQGCGRRQFSGTPCECPEPVWAIEYSDGAPSGSIRMQRWHEAWAREALRVLKPGGHLLAFGGTRTSHRLVCAIEDAGFEIRDTIAWMYGSGFPKSLDVARAVRGDLGARWFAAPYGTPLADAALAALEDALPVVEAAAEKVEGHGTALKPAFEPIVVARKPLAGTVAGNVLSHGTGALNVDGCRVGATVETWPSSRSYDSGQMREPGSAPRGQTEPAGTPPAGRWPANVVLDPEAAALLDEQTGELGVSAGGLAASTGAFGKSGIYSAAAGDPRETPPGYGDSGGASRFFYCAKTSSAERNAGLDGFPEQGTTADGYGSIQTPKLDRAAPRENWTPHPVRNVHPTVKPIELMRWLVRLITPPGGTVLDPFAGSGTTGCAAALEGFAFVGIEREPEYATIARARIAWWTAHPDGMELVDRLAAEREQRDVAESGQLSIEWST